MYVCTCMCMCVCVCEILTNEISFMKLNIIFKYIDENNKMETSKRAMLCVEYLRYCSHAVKVKSKKLAGGRLHWVVLILCLFTARWYSL